MQILESASKLVFLMLALTACIAFILGILESKDFMVLAISAFSFYFAYKGSENSSGGGQPFSGK
jgi:asparagine N-glycosylation enzyme membrane subunit Stt3